MQKKVQYNYIELTIGKTTQKWLSLKLIESIMKLILKTAYMGMEKEDIKELFLLRLTKLCKKYIEINNSVKFSKRKHHNYRKRLYSY